MIPRKKSNTDGNDITKKVVGSTGKGKKLIIDQNPQGYFFSKFATGGQLPPQLGGRFTRYEFAEYQISSYLKGK